jgi:hypothetical protein
MSGLASNGLVIVATLGLELHPTTNNNDAKITDIFLAFI